MRERWPGRVVGAVVGAAVLAVASACGIGSGSSSELTVYSAQHQDLVTAMLAGFSKDTGIKVVFRSGSDFELGNQIVQEGSASPADVFLTENSPAMSLVAGKGLLAPLDADTLAQVPARDAASAKDWIGFAARSTVLAYNPLLQPKDGLPTSIMDLAGPTWKDGVGIAAAGADFQAIVSAVLAVKGEPATLAWLKGLKANAKIYRSNVAVMAAVNAGEVRTGIMYHYYWYQDQAESGSNSKNVQLKFFGGKDAGAFVSVSGAGVLTSSKHAADAQKLVNYLTGEQGQQALVSSNALEYPVGNGIAANSELKPLSELDPPTVDLSTLNGPRVVQLMQQAGLL
jgi:iron(III) transport system substrate-binding protein